MIPCFNDCEKRYLRTTAEITFNIASSEIVFAGLNQLFVELPNMSKKNMKKFSHLIRQIYGAFLVGKGLSGCVYVTSKHIHNGVEFRCWYLTTFEVDHQNSVNYAYFKSNQSANNDPRASDFFICTNLLTL